MFDERNQPIEAAPSTPVPFEPTTTQPVVEVFEPSTSMPIETVAPPAFTPASTPIAPQPELEQQPVSVAPMAPVAPPAPGVGDQVWISREEYQRLQQAQVIASRNPDPRQEKPTKLISNAQVAAAAAAAIALLLGLISHSSFFALLIAPSLIVLALLGAFTLQDYLKAKKPGNVIKPHKGRNRTLLTIAIVVLALPILMPAALILMFVIACAGGGCNGS